MRRVLIVLTLLIATAAPAAAQAVFSGTVVGPDGLPVEGSRIFVTHIASRTQLDFTTLADGRFEFSGLPAGDYRVTGPQGFTLTLAAGERVDREIRIPFGPFVEDWSVMPADLVATFVKSEQRPGFRCSTRMFVNVNGVYQPFCNLSFIVDEFEQDEQNRLDTVAAGRGAAFAGPRMLRPPNQAYPDALLAARVEGVVTLEIRIGADGAPNRVQVVGSENPALNDAALAVGASARWEPARMRGAAVEVPITVRVAFRLQPFRAPIGPRLPAQSVALQVVRVTPTEETARRMVFFKPSGPYRITNYTIRELIRFAYTIDDAHIVGLPAWADTERFDIEQQFETEPTAGEVQGLVRDILALQFGLTTHIEKRDFQGYGLVRFGASLGTQLRRSTVDCARQPPSGPAGVTPCQLRLGEQGIYGVGMTMAQLATEMAGSGYIRVDRPVVDRTGLTGTYDFEISLLRMARSEAPAAGGGVRIASVRSPDALPVLLERELGLRLVEQPVPADVLVVDRVRRPIAAR
jgi:uncharacterized protein (TIGR03435 family)